MFGSMFDDVVDVGKKAVSGTIEVATLGLVTTKDAQKLVDQGMTIVEIAAELDMTTKTVKMLLKK